MHRIEIEGTDLILEYPDSGYEFTRRHFLSFSRLVLLFNAKILSFQQFKVRLTYDFLNLKRTADLKDPEHHNVIDNVAMLSEFANAYFKQAQEKGETKHVIDMVYFNQLLPTIKANGRTFYGPESALVNTVYGEYLQALICFEDYSRTGDTEHLDRLIATLYRPAKLFYGTRRLTRNFTEDRRRRFNPELTNHYASKLKRLSPEIKQAIYLFFASCQHFIATNDSLEIGGGNAIDLRVLFKKQSNKKGKGLGLVATLYSIAESNIFGTVKEVSNQNTYDVLAYLVDQQNRMEEIKSKNKNA